MQKEITFGDDTSNHQHEAGGSRVEKIMDIDNAMSCWMDLAASLGANETEAARVWLHTLHPRYTEAHRHYHTLDHIISCINHLYGLGLGNDGVDDVELALWFHDVSYDTHIHDNEERSALMLLGCGAAMGMNLAMLHKVADMIRATKHADPGAALSNSEEAKSVLDLDLSALGSEPVAFIRMCLGIRKEYDWVPDDVYKPTRAKIMQGFLDRHFIYGTQECRDKWEEQARINITGEIARMKA